MTADTMPWTAGGAGGRERLPASHVHTRWQPRSPVHWRRTWQWRWRCHRRRLHSGAPGLRWRSGMGQNGWEAERHLVGTLWDWPAGGGARVLSQTAPVGPDMHQPTPARGSLWPCCHANRATDCRSLGMQGLAAGGSVQGGERRKRAAAAPKTLPGAHRARTAGLRPRPGPAAGG